MNKLVLLILFIFLVNTIEIEANPIVIPVASLLAANGLVSGLVWGVGNAKLKPYNLKGSYWGTYSGGAVGIAVGWIILHEKADYFNEQGISPLIVFLSLASGGNITGFRITIAEIPLALKLEPHNDQMNLQLSMKF